MTSIQKDYTNICIPIMQQLAHLQDRIYTLIMYIKTDTQSFLYKGPWRNTQYTKALFRMLVLLKSLHFLYSVILDCTFFKLLSLNFHCIKSLSCEMGNLCSSQACSSQAFVHVDKWASTQNTVHYIKYVTCSSDRK